MKENRSVFVDSPDTFVVFSSSLVRSMFGDSEMLEYHNVKSSFELLRSLQFMLDYSTNHRKDSNSLAKRLDYP